MEAKKMESILSSKYWIVTEVSQLETGIKDSIVEALNSDWPEHWKKDSIVGALNMDSRIKYRIEDNSLAKELWLMGDDSDRNKKNIKYFG